MPRVNIHSMTAKICEDIAQPTPDPEIKHPEPIRRNARLVTIAVAGALLVAAIVVMAVRIPKLQSEKRTFSSDSTEEVDKWLNEATVKKHTITCPCHTQVMMSWCNVTTFHFLKRKAGDKRDAPAFQVYNFSNDEGGDYLPNICNSTAKPFRATICSNILSPVLNSRDSRTFLPTASAFIDRKQLYNEIATRIDTNAYEALSTFSFLQFMNQTENFNYSIALTELVRTMVSQFENNSSSSLEDYWNAAQAKRQEYNMSSSYGMEVSWQRYLQICNPPFCDEEFPISALNRVLRAMGQVGGIATVLGLALKFVLWPLVRFVLRFPASNGL